ncbi:MAG: hypothetical protein QG630_438 [Patescibacteria group bacterium]|nr:hypothetical protein [Patescibacteria group bacterium]
MKLQLKNITLVIIDSINLERAQIALDICQKYIDFGDVKLLTDLEEDKDKRIVKIVKIDSVKKYSTFCIKELNNYVNTDYCLLIQYDGFILSPVSWDDNFLKYDYIGCKDIKRSGEENSLVLNGGFTLRSKKLLEKLSLINDEELEKELEFGEDYIIFKLRNDLENGGIIFPDLSVVERFATDASNRINSKDIKSFGFHGLFIDLDYLFKDNPEFSNLKKYYKNEVHFLKIIYSKTLSSFNKIPFLYKIVRGILLFIKKIYYKYIY